MDDIGRYRQCPAHRGRVTRTTRPSYYRSKRGVFSLVFFLRFFFFLSLFVVALGAAKTAGRAEERKRETRSTEEEG